MPVRCRRFHALAGMRRLTASIDVNAIVKINRNVAAANALLGGCARTNPPTSGAARDPRDHDGAIPSGAALATLGLLRLGLVAGDEAALKLAERYLVQRLGAATAANAWSMSALLVALDLYLHAKVLVVTDGDDRDTLLATARCSYAPTLCIAGPWAAPSITDGKATGPDGRARAFVCTGPTCSAPVSDPIELATLLTAD